MPRAIRLFVHYVEALNRRVGRAVMYLIFGMMGVLLYSTISRAVFDVPLIWVVEVAQMTMAAYYLLGGAYSMQLDAHVRMDVLYCRWTPRHRAFADSLTSACLLAYVVILCYGGISSTHYSMIYNQRNFSAWAPLMAPIKVLMTIGIALMLLQVLATFCRDLARARGAELP
jgi:TRAP-type mannitol/chloroaromatic compound transport system permease small subunit